MKYGAVRKFYHTNALVYEILLLNLSLHIKGSYPTIGSRQLYYHNLLFLKEIRN